MRERFRRCGYWPNCDIHVGDRLVADIGSSERFEMYSKFKLGMTTGEIGRDHQLDYWQVYRIIAAIETLEVGRLQKDLEKIWREGLRSLRGVA